MKPINIRNDNTANQENNVNNQIWSSVTKLQNLTEKIEESKWNDSQTPNPQKAPLNYIDNMWEWEKAQKKYVEDVAQKQQELLTILWAYEDKTEETSRFREAKSKLEIQLEKIMWTIVDQLKDYDDFLFLVYEKIFQNNNEWENNEEWDINENNIENRNINEEKNLENWNNEKDNETSNENVEESEKNKSTLAEEIASILSGVWINVTWVSVVPINMLNQENWKWELLDDAQVIINKFLSVVEPENRNKYKGLLDKLEITWIENLHTSLKKQLKNYIELLYQIDLIDAKIDKLENEENLIYSKYCQGVKESKKMEEDMEKINETYFLNSYLSTKNVSLNSFVSNPLVEKQISNIIELSKKWLSIPKTILLYWNFNSWKTYAANVIATELWRKMYHIKSYDIFTWWFSDPNAMLDAIFTWAIKKKEPCIIFLDEIENFYQWYDWSPYQNLLENTIRHHISKIKESNLDIIIIWAISNRKKVSPDLLKQDVFSKQIYFTWLDREKAEKFFNIILTEKNIKLWDDVNIQELLNKQTGNQEYIKKLITFAVDFHKLNNTWDSENITLSLKDFDDAINYLSKYLDNFSKIWYNLS